ncbi:MAG: trigger factor [Parachlamydiaceae bacterium]|nr:trigger factor [Parachlamydiaceae bacterium]
MTDQIQTAQEASTPPVKEFKNDHLSVHVEELPGCIAKLKIVISPTASQAVYAKAIKTVGKEVSIPGFRKGKAPVETILKKHSKFVEQEWEDKLLRTSVDEALTLAHLSPYGKGSVTKIDFKEKSRDKESRISLQVEHSPVVPLVKLTDVVLNKIEPEAVTDEAIEAEVKALQLHYATWEPIEGRGAEKGDYIILDIQSLEDPKTMICENTRFLVEKDQMSPWMYKLIVGLKEGDSIEGVSEQDADAKANYDEEGNEKPFVPAHFKLTAKGLHKPILPELNDEFIKKLGASSEEDLRGKISKELQKANSLKAWKNLEAQVLSQIVEKYHFEIPNRECEEEKAFQTTQMQEQLKDPKLSSSEKFNIIRTFGQNIEAIPVSYRLFFIAKHFAGHYNIGVTKKELSDELNQYFTTNMHLLQGNEDQADTVKRVQIMLFNQLILHKVVAFIIQHARYA